MKICPICKEYNKDENSKCYNCGTLFTEEIKHYCQHCSNEIEAGENLCDRCRTKRGWLIFLFVILSLLVSIITIICINFILALFLSIKLGYLFEYAILFFFICTGVTTARNIFKKPKKIKSIQNTNYATSPPIANTQTDEKSTEENEIFEIPDKSTDNSIAVLENKPKERNKKKYKLKYCKHCGGLIDSETKKCTSCGKQYFHIPKLKFNKTVCITLILLTVISLTTGFNVYQYNKLMSDNNEISSLTEQVESLNNQLSSKQGEIFLLNSTVKTHESKIESLEKQINFYENHVAIVYDYNTNLYHKYICYDAALKIYKNGDSSFWIYNTEAAEKRGYSPCPSCH